MEADTLTDSRRRKDRLLVALGLALLAAVLAGVVLIGPQDPTSVRLPVRTFSFPSTSMEPTLRLGEYAFANMRAYASEPPGRGDIVIFTLPREPQTTYIKRVVGLPGETVQMRNGILHINGQPVQVVDAGSYEIAAHESEPTARASLKRETLPNGVTFMTLDLISNSLYDNTQVYQVPPESYFVLGDNRDNSADSRMLGKFGYIPRANVIGRISWIYWSPDRSRIGTVPK